MSNQARISEYRGRVLECPAFPVPVRNELSRVQEYIDTQALARASEMSASPKPWPSHYSRMLGPQYLDERIIANALIDTLHTDMSHSRQRACGPPWRNTLGALQSGLVHKPTLTPVLAPQRTSRGQQGCRAVLLALMGDEVLLG
jgi:hypothetical protein